MAARKISDFTLGDRGIAVAQMNWYGCNLTAYQDWRPPSGPAWLAGTGTGARFSAHEIALTLTGRRSTAVLPRGGRLAPGLSFCLTPKHVSHFLSRLSPGHMSYPGQTGGGTLR